MSKLFKKIAWWLFIAVEGAGMAALKATQKNVPHLYIYPSKLDTPLRLVGL